jgi:predicted transcriptional regulator of viral defense system
MGNMKLETFFAQHPVFTFEEVFNALSKNQQVNPSTLYNSLAYHRARGHITRIRRGLYYSIPQGIEDSTAYPVDPFLVASKIAPDAVLGYRTALAIFGKLHTLSNEFIYLSAKLEKSPYVFQNVKYRKVSIPTSLKKKNQERFGVTSVDRLGQEVFVTSLERTLVDILDRPNLCGSWEEIWRSLESIEYFDIEEVLNYALLLENSTTIAKLGFFLDTHRETLLISDKNLEQLLKHLPKKPHYLETQRTTPQKLIAKWNIIVPLNLINRNWEEPGENI